MVTGVALSLARIACTKFMAGMAGCIAKMQRAANLSILPPPETEIRGLFLPILTLGLAPGGPNVLLFCFF